MCPTKRYPKIRIGQRFTRLIVTSKWLGGINGAQWFCLCDCGVAIVAAQCNLHSGNTKSCGCIHKEDLTRRNFRHGYATRKNKVSEYRIWQSMIQRCHNPRDKAYRHYGARGIHVCERWRHSFENFLADVGSKPKGHWIERVNNDGSYTPENCKWATPKEQRKNQRPRRRKCKPKTKIS